MYTATGTLDRQDYLERYAPLVKRMAHHLLAKLPASVELDDIIQAGLIGLMDAVSRFEEDHGTQFEAYAVQRIRGAMLDELRHGDWLPRAARRNQRRIEAAISALEQRNRRAPTAREIADELAMPLPEYQHLLGDVRGHHLVHLEELGESDSDEDYLERNAPASGGEPLGMLEDRRFRGALVEAIRELPEREKQLMGMYYEQELNFREIAAVFGVTESRVCQLHAQAVSRLRARLREWRRA